jgi:hypothetical protein
VELVAHHRRRAGEIPTAYVNSLAVGDPLPSLPIFLSEEEYVPAPLEATYAEAWRVFPTLLKEVITPAPGFPPPE